MGHHHHHHHHGHRHAPHGQADETGDWRLTVSIAVNVLLTVAQIVGGLLSGSLALIADALHNLSDAASLLIAVLARRIARRPADARMTFGYGRAEVVAALINFTTLILIGVFLGYEAIMRLFDPQPVEGWTVVIIAGIALIVDAVTVLLTYAMARDSMNVRAAFLHNLADALASVGVIIGGIVILLYDWTLIDPLLTLAISGYVLWHGLAEINGAIRILMLGTPDELDPGEVVDAMRAVPGVCDVHHVHLWRFDERRVFLEAHVVVADDSGPATERTKAALRSLLTDRFAIDHVTLETECSDTACQAGGGVPL